MKKKNLIKKFLSMRNRMIMIYTILILILYIGVCIFLYNINNKEKKMQIKENVYNEAKNTMLNVNNYCNKIKKNVDIIYENSYDVSFYPNSSKLNIFERNHMNDLSKKLCNFNLMLNYCDFGIVYSNGSVVGVLSDGFKRNKKDNLYNKIDKYLDDKSEIWYSDVSYGGLRSYYLKKINENAIFVVSFYVTDFESVINKPDKSSKLSIFLLDRYKSIIYSVGNSDLNLGDQLPDGIFNYGNNNDKISCSYECENGWKIYAYTDLSKMNQSSTNVEMIILIIGIFSFIFFIMIGFIICEKTLYSIDIEEEKNLIKRDSLTGLLNKYGTEKLISDIIEKSVTMKKYAFILIRLEDYKNIPENFIKDFFDMLKNFWKIDNIAGKRDEEEFIIYLNFNDMEKSDIYQEIQNRCEGFCKKYSEFDIKKYNIENIPEVQIGVSIYPDDGITYSDLYDTAFKSSTSII